MEDRHQEMRNETKRESEQRRYSEVKRRTLDDETRSNDEKETKKGGKERNRCGAKKFTESHFSRTWKIILHVLLLLWSLLSLAHGENSLTHQ